MNFDATKRYSKMVNDIAAHISSTNDLYEAAATLPYDINQYYIYSLDCLVEITFAINNQVPILPQVVDEYISTDIVCEVFTSAFYTDSNLQFEFVKRDLGNQHNILYHASLDILTIDIVSHPIKYDEAAVNVAHDQYLYKRLDNMQLNMDVRKIAEDSLRKKVEEGDKKEVKKYKLKSERPCKDLS